MSQDHIQYSAAADFVIDLGHGIYAIDTGFHRPRFDAAYLVVERGRALFVDTGTNHGIPRLLAALEAVGLPRDAVDHVIPTHVHLDHAGGAGLLMQELPGATMLIHPRGERHMVDPGALVQGATAVYGAEEVERSYGSIVPVPAERVRTTHDGMVLDWHGRRLTFLDTPGHARHHHCLFDERSRGFFTGDTFGLSYREFDTERGPWLLPTTTPVQFEPARLKASIRRMLDFEPVGMYLTHFARVGRDATEVRSLGEQLLEQIDEMVGVAASVQAQPAGPQRHRALKDALARAMLRRVRAHGCTMSDREALDLLATDVELNAQGLSIWMQRGGAA